MSKKHSHKGNCCVCETETTQQVFSRYLKNPEFLCYDLLCEKTYWRQITERREAQQTDL